MSEYHIGHLEIDSPFGNAGGVVKHVEDVEKMAHTGVGWIEAGSYTLEPRAGNAVNPDDPDGPLRTVYYHDPATGETFNSLGMPNKGMDSVMTHMPNMAKVAHGHDKPLLVNVAPVSDDPAAESIELVRRAYESGADAVLLNAGCPNVVIEGGGRHEILSHNVEALETTLAGLKAVTERFQPIFIRTSPVKTVEGVGAHKAFKIYQAIHKSGVVSAIFTPNSWPGHRPLNEDEEPILEVAGGIGGKSGPATAPDAIDEAAWAIGSLRGTGLDIVMSGSIVDGATLNRRVNENQLAAGAGTTFFYESGDWKHDVDKLIWEFEDSRQT
jgi:dihydroorotate dehydrogenase